MAASEDVRRVAHEHKMYDMLAWMPSGSEDMSAIGVRDLRRCTTTACYLNTADKKRPEVDKLTQEAKCLLAIMDPKLPRDQPTPLRSVSDVEIEIEQHRRQWTDEHTNGTTPATDKATLQAWILGKLYNDLAKDRSIVRLAAIQRTISMDESSTREKYATPWYEQAWYIIWPCSLFAACFSFQSVMLHIGTHFYIEYMQSEPDVGDGQLFDVVGNFVAVASGDANETQQSGPNTEVAFVQQGHFHVDLRVLDASGFIPFLLFLVSYGIAGVYSRMSIGLWNKTFVVASMMAVMKGVFDVVTIMPDSIGWKQCQKRLTEEGIDVMDTLDFSHDGLDSLFDLLGLEIFGKSGKRIRYCADMMISGHTYFAALFALSAYKQIQILFPRRVMSRRAILFVCFTCIFAEMVLVAAQRFHYTVDMLAAIVLVVLLFDSRHVEQLAADWSEGFRWRDPQHFRPKVSIFYKLYTQYRYHPKETHPGEPKVCPSQATELLNFRAINLCPPWKDSGGLEASCGNCFCASRSRPGSREAVVQQGEAQEQTPLCTT